MEHDDGRRLAAMWHSSSEDRGMFNEADCFMVKALNSDRDTAGRRQSSPSSMRGIHSCSNDPYSVGDITPVYRYLSRRPDQGRILQRLRPIRTVCRLPFVPLAFDDGDSFCDAA